MERLKVYHVSLIDYIYNNIIHICILGTKYFSVLKKGQGIMVKSGKIKKS